MCFKRVNAVNAIRCSPASLQALHCYTRQSYGELLGWLEIPRWCRLGEVSIGTGIHYPIPLHLQNAYRELGYKAGDLPVTEKAAAEIVSLPMFPGLSAEQQERVAAMVAGRWWGEESVVESGVRSGVGALWWLRSANVSDELQNLRNAGYKPVLVGPQPFSFEEILRNVDPAPDEESERFVAAIYADRRQAAENSSPE